MFNGFIFSQEDKKDKSKINFKPGASHQSKSDKKKIPPYAIISPDGKHYYIKDGKKSLSCYKITDGEKDEKLWSKTFESKVEDFRIAPKSGDRIEVITKEGIWISDIFKGNFAYTGKIKEIDKITWSPSGKTYAGVNGKKLVFRNAET